MPRAAEVSGLTMSGFVITSVSFWERFFLIVSEVSDSRKSPAEGNSAVSAKLVTALAAVNSSTEAVLDLADLDTDETPVVSDDAKVFDLSANTLLPLLP